MSIAAAALSSDPVIQLAGSARGTGMMATSAAPEGHVASVLLENPAIFAALNGEPAPTSIDPNVNRVVDAIKYQNFDSIDNNTVLSVMSAVDRRNAEVAEGEREASVRRVARQEQAEKRTKEEQAEKAERTKAENAEESKKQVKKFERAARRANAAEHEEALFRDQAAQAAQAAQPKEEREKAEKNHYAKFVSRASTPSQPRRTQAQAGIEVRARVSAEAEAARAAAEAARAVSSARAAAEAEAEAEAARAVSAARVETAARAPRVESARVFERSSQPASRPSSGSRFGLTAAGGVAAAFATTLAAVNYGTQKRRALRASRARREREE